MYRDDFLSISVLKKFMAIVAQTISLCRPFLSPAYIHTASVYRGIPPGLWSKGDMGGVPLSCGFRTFPEGEGTPSPVTGTRTGYPSPRLA